MKKINFLFIVVILLVFTVDAFAERKFIIVAEEFPPFEFVKEGQAVGIDVDIATKIFNEMNIDFEVQIHSWKRAWRNIELGKADAVFSTSRKDKRKPFLYYPDEDMWVSEYVFFTQGQMKNPVSITYKDAQNKNSKIGIIKGNSYHDSFWAAYPNKPDGSLNDMLEGAISAELNLKKLAKKRIDLFIIDKIVGSYIIKNNNLQDKLTYSDQVLFSKGYPMPFAKKSDYPDIENIAKQFEQKLIEMKKSGEYQKIIDKWIKKGM